MIDGGSRAFAHGCNYPWSTDGQTVFYGLDFGANVGVAPGVSTRRVPSNRISTMGRPRAERRALVRVL